MSSITRSSGSERSRNARASGRAAAEQRALAAEHAVQPPARRVREREQPQRLAGRRAVDDDRVPLAGLGVALELEQAEQLVGAGRDGQLLGGDPLDAALGEHAAEPLLRGRPVALELVLRLHLLGPDAVADLGRLGADRGLQRLGQRVRGIGREDERARARRGAAARGGGSDGRLPDAALARVQDDPRRQGPGSLRSLLLLGLQNSDRRRWRRRGLPARSVAASVTS